MAVAMVQEDQLEDRPFRRHPAGRDQARLCAVRQRQGPVPWSGPSRIRCPLHREPLYTNRRDLLDKTIATYEDRKMLSSADLVRLDPERRISPRTYPMILTSGPPRGIRGWWRRVAPTRGLPSFSRTCSSKSIRAMPTTSASSDGEQVWVNEGPEKAQRSRSWPW